MFSTADGLDSPEGFQSQDKVKVNCIFKNPFWGFLF